MNHCFQLNHQVFEASLLAGQSSVFNFLQPRYAKYPLESLHQWFTENRILLNGQQVASDTPVSSGDCISILFPGHIEEDVDTSWHPVWQNKELLVVYKPALLPVSRTTRNLYNTLIQLVRRETPYYDAHLLHRLDTETSGLIVLAKDKAADKKWKKQINQLIERKIYHARVKGKPDWQHTYLNCELSERIGSEIRSQVYVVDSSQLSLYPKPKLSESRFRLLESDNSTSLIECELITGRKHQIRAQLAHLGLPIIGDKIYSQTGQFYLKRLQGALDEEDMAILGAPYHQLTAAELWLRPDQEQPTIKLSLEATTVAAPLL